MQKIAIIGAGRVGESTAQFLAKTDIAEEIVLTDIREGVAERAALDIQETAPLFGFDTRVSGATDPAALAGRNLHGCRRSIPPCQHRAMGWWDGSQRVRRDSRGCHTVVVAQSSARLVATPH